MLTNTLKNIQMIEISFMWATLDWERVKQLLPLVEFPLNVILAVRIFHYQIDLKRLMWSLIWILVSNVSRFFLYFRRWYFYSMNSSMTVCSPKLDKSWFEWNAISFEFWLFIVIDCHYTDCHVAIFNVH